MMNKYFVCFKNRAYWTCSSLNIKVRYWFGQSSKPSAASQQRRAKQIQIEHRKKLMEQHQIRMMQDKIQNTKGNFNPTLAYLRLYRSVFIKLALLFGFLFVGGLYLYVGGIHKDPLNGNKKLVLISDAFEKSMDGYLRDIIVNQLCHGLSERTSPALSERGRYIEEWLASKTNRRYKVVMVGCEEHVITILPQTIVISKNMLLSRELGKEDLTSLLLLMESLFVKKFHIRDLSMPVVLTFFFSRLNSTPFSDIKLTSIYNRKYSEDQVQQTLKEMSEAYSIDLQQLTHSLSAILTNVQRLSSQTSHFSLRNRLQSPLLSAQ